MENEKENKLSKIQETGLLDVVSEWVKSKRFVSVIDVQREFSVGYETANCVLNWLIDEGLVEKEPTYSRGHRVINRTLGLKIYLLDRNPKMVAAWKKSFQGYEGIEIVEDEFSRFMDVHDVECVVSPANSFGQMDGGYDLAITEYFGIDLEKAVQRKIIKDCHGEQPVGTSIIMDIPGTMKKLIHTPTMRLPSLIKDPMVIYQCMRVTLMLAIEKKVKSIVIPAFGACCGGVPVTHVAELMRKGFEQILVPID